MLTAVIGTVIMYPSMAFADGIFRVDVDSTASSPDGLAWTTAFRDIQPAIDAAASANGGEVWVAKGTYGEMRVSISDDGETGSLVLRDNVSVFGGFLGHEQALQDRASDPSATIIDGSASRQGEPAFHVVLDQGIAGPVTFDGFTVTGGRAFDCADRRGAGMFSSGFVLINNCVFEANSADQNGGGLAGGLHVSNCLFIGNTSNSAGGGANPGPVIEDCVFRNNSAREGSALWVASSEEPDQVRRCIIANNFLQGGPGAGGALKVDGNVIVENCMFLNNSSSSSKAGGAIFHGGSRDPMTLEYSSRGDFINCTFVGNSSPGGSVIRHGSSVLVFQNCIMWDNDGPWASQGDPRKTIGWVQNCIIDPRNQEIPGEEFGVKENIFEGDPWFVNPAAMDFRLRPGSPAIDAGIAEYLIETSHVFPGDKLVTSPSDDIEGTPRPLGNAHDIGAYEFDPEAEFTDPFDPTGDQMSDAADLQHIINQVLGTTTPITDLNNDGETNAADIQLMINWLLGVI